MRWVATALLATAAMVVAAATVAVAVATVPKAVAQRDWYTALVPAGVAALGRRRERTSRRLRAGL